MSKKTFNLVPIGRNLVVRRASVDMTSEAGIIMPESFTEQKLNEGEVMAIGKGDYDIHGQRLPLDVEVGDLILWGDYTGNDISSGDESYCILSEKDILVIVRD